MNKADRSVEDINNIISNLEEAASMMYSDTASREEQIEAAEYILENTKYYEEAFIELERTYE